MSALERTCYMPQIDSEAVCITDKAQFFKMPTGPISLEKARLYLQEEINWYCLHGFPSGAVVVDMTTEECAQWRIHFGGACMQCGGSLHHGLSSDEIEEMDDLCFCDVPHRDHQQYRWFVERNGRPEVATGELPLALATIFHRRSHESKRPKDAADKWIVDHSF